MKLYAAVIVRVSGFEDPPAPSAPMPTGNVMFAPTEIPESVFSELASLSEALDPQDAQTVMEMSSLLRADPSKLRAVYDTLRQVGLRIKDPQVRRLFNDAWNDVGEYAQFQMPTRS